MSKKYSPEDVKALIRVASQIHNENETISNKEFSKKEIIEIAEAAGIPSDTINQALNYLDIHEEPRWTPNKEETVHIFRFFGDQDSDINLEAIANNCRKYYKTQGTAAQFGSTFEWSASPSKTKQVHLSINQSRQVAKVDLREDYSKLGNRFKMAGAVLGFVLLAIFSSLMNLDSISNWVPALINFSGAGLGYMFSSRLFGKYLNSKKRKAKRLLNTLSKSIQTGKSTTDLEEDALSKNYTGKKKLKH